MNNKGYRISTEVFNTEQYQQYQQFFEGMGMMGLRMKGHPDINNVVIYFSEMAYLLTERGIIAKNLDTNTEEMLPGGEYARSYIEGFNEGVAYFNERWSLMPDTLYGPKSDHYFNDLRAAYEGTGDRSTPLGIVSNAMKPGWLEEAERIPLIINDEAVRNSGYYAGLVSKYRELELKHDRLRVRMEQEGPEQKREPKPFRSTLEAACVSEAAYRAARGYFIKNEYCHPDTLVKTSLITQEGLAAKIKGLKVMGYTYKLKNEEVLAIMNNTFSAEAKIWSVTRVRPDTIGMRSFLGQSEIQ